MRKLLLFLVVFGTIAAVPADAAPVMQTTPAGIASLDLNTAVDQSSVQTVQYGYNRREYYRRREFRHTQRYHQLRDPRYGRRRGR